MGRNNDIPPRRARIIALVRSRIDRPQAGNPQSPSARLAQRASQARRTDTAGQSDHMGDDAKSNPEDCDG